MTRPAFSVVIPVFNRRRALYHTLSGIADAAGATPVEVLLVDNNSDTEPPLPVYEAFREHLDVTLLLQPRLPHTFALCRARNLGARIAKHAWLVCLDGDCIPGPRFFDTLSRLAQPGRLLVGARQFVRERDCRPGVHLDRLARVPSASNYGLPVDRRADKLPQLGSVAHPWAYCHGGNLAFERSLAQSVGGFDEAYDGRWGYEDIDFAWKMVVQGGAVPTWNPGLDVYHQEADHEEPQTAQRFDKATNDNWHRVCSRIPGFHEHKLAEYRQLSAQIVV